MSRRLCSRAPFTTSFLPLPRRRLSGIATWRSPRRNAPVIERGSPSTASSGPLAMTCAAVLARAGPDVDDPVRGPDRLLVVLDDEDRVAQVPQPGQRRDELRVVALVEADRRLVEDVQHAHQRRPDLRREPDPLRLAARQADRRPVEGQVVEPDVHEEPEPRDDLLEHLAADRRSRSVIRSPRSLAQSSASVTESPDTSAMLRSSRCVTARTSGRSRLPPQVGHGFWTMNFSSSVRMYSDSVSRYRRSRLVIDALERGDVASSRRARGGT